MEVFYKLFDISTNSLAEKIANTASDDKSINIFIVHFHDTVIIW